MRHQKASWWRKIVKTLKMFDVTSPSIHITIIFVCWVTEATLLSIKIEGDARWSTHMSEYKFHFGYQSDAICASRIQQFEWSQFPVISPLQSTCVRVPGPVAPTGFPTSITFLTKVKNNNEIVNVSTASYG
jgi:hypothetical protein